MGRKCLLTLHTSFSFKIGTMFANFHRLGNDWWRSEQLVKLETGYAKISAYSFQTKFGTSSAPGALEILSELSLL